MIVFWTTNEQRRRRFERVDTVHKYTGHAWASDDLTMIDVYVAGRRRRVRVAAMFDDATTPPTLIVAYHSLRWLASKRADFPTVFFNRPNGDLYDLHAPDAEGNPIGGIIFPGPESTEPSPPKTYP